MNEYDVKVYFEKKKIITALGELVQNDYNSTKLNFTFDKTGSRVLFKLLYPDNTSYVDEIKNNQLVLKPGVLNQSGYYSYEISLYDSNSRITDYAIGQIYVRNELVDTDEVVEPDDRVPILDNLINEVDNMNMHVTKSGRITTITIVKKDGTTQTETLEDGKSIEYNWQGTSLGIRQEGQSEYQYVNLQGPKGDAGAIKMVIVNELPTTGKDDTIYLVPLENPDIQGNNYAEYVWINNAWELLGKIGVQVDLTDYVKNTDYATDVKGGVIKAVGTYGVSVFNGNIYSVIKSYNQYLYTTDNNAFISKGTLENVIVGKDLTTKAYVDGLVGDIGTILDNINGESVGA